jgi:hypothetical protein
MREYDPDKHCGGQRPNQPPGTLCTLTKGWGTDHPGVGHCRRHAGNTPSHRVAAQREIARQECDRLGIPIEVDPGEALIREVFETAGNVAFYRALVQELPTHPDPDVYVPGDGETEGHWERGNPGVYGRTYHVSGVPTGEAKPHILVTLYNDERKHLTDVALGALRAGVDERRVRLAEQDATWVMDAQVKALIAIGMGDRLEDFRRAFGVALDGVEPPVSLGDTSTDPG